jgi:hypothetical protein
MWFLYENDSKLVGSTSGDNSYYYTKNPQGNITGIVFIAEFWGLCLQIPAFDFQRRQNQNFQKTHNTAICQHLRHCDKIGFSVSSLVSHTKTQTAWILKKSVFMRFFLYLV